LCASCGTVIQPNPANMCINCIRHDVDITEGIPKQATVHFCKGCDRYLAPPNLWVQCELESKELLALLLKKLKGLQKVRLVDASFIWTEPHSRRIKVKLTIQKEVFANTILQQVFVIEYIVANQYCPECTRVDAQLTWKAVVQLRQKVSHKRTFYLLEQIILKHNAHRDTSNIKEFRDGLDFYYTARNGAIKMVEFLNSVVPMRMKQSQELISSDIHAGTADYKFTYSVELVPICKDDLVCMPIKVARSLGDMSPLALVSKVSNALMMLDFQTGKYSELRPSQFWENQFPALCEAKDLVEFYVIDIQMEHTTPKYGIAIAEICRAEDFSTTYQVRTHLGYILNPGDHCKGYMIGNANFNNDFLDVFAKNKQLPDVVIVKKSYPNARKKIKSRRWKLKSMAKVEGEEIVRKQDKTRQEQDLEMFKRDLEEDPELRGLVNLYK
ncbi:NMD3 family-domain-containing protein, partial [Gorgonomyces haynaldii]